MQIRRNLLFVLVLLIAVPALVSCASSSKKKNEAQALLKLGESEFRAGNNQAAFLKYQEAVRLDPRNKEIHVALGNVYLKLEDNEHAKEHYKRAIRIDRDYSEAYNNLCYLYYIQKEYDEALENCNRALENLLYATPEKSYYTIGRIYYDQRLFDKSIEAYTQALRRNPIFFQAYYALALAYNADRKYGPAAEALESAIAFDPRFKGDRKKAEQGFRRLKTSSDNPREYQTFIEILHY